LSFTLIHIHVEKRQALCTEVESKLLPDFENEASLKTVGLIVNPIAGMGGAVGLKGTDGKAILERAIVLGAKPMASARAKTFLSELQRVKKRVQLVVGAGRMGEDQARSCGFACTVLGKRKKETTAQDTKEIARRITDTEAALLIFCGGDGTARDVLNAVNTHLPVLGVPTGVKMHSAVFAVEPKAAAKIAMEFLWGEMPRREAEVMDGDEEAFREGRVSAELYGYMLSPYEPY
jgi:predicted polyphosphate/ATP-dependent NAD kinase